MPFRPVSDTLPGSVTAPTGHVYLSYTYMCEGLGFVFLMKTLPGPRPMEYDSMT